MIRLKIGEVSRGRSREIAAKSQVVQISISVI